MEAEIQVLQPGLFSSIQDLGRFGFQKYGVPQSGVMDRNAMRICNLVLGNNEEAAVLEITLQGPSLKFDAPTMVSIAGADLSPHLNGASVPLNHRIEIQKGDILKFSKRKSGFRAYLGIKGGFKTEELMNSRSWYEGLTEQSRLRKGTILKYTSKAHDNTETFSTVKINANYLLTNEIEFYPGPEFALLSTEQEVLLLNKEFIVEQSSNRMAVQFEGKLENKIDPIITGPVVPGTIQLTPSGRMMVLMRDCQTTGGYPRIMQLSEKGIQTLSQKMPGENITFLKKEYPDRSQ